MQPEVRLQHLPVTTGPQQQSVHPSGRDADHPGRTAAKKSSSGRSLGVAPVPVPNSTAVHMQIRRSPDVREPIDAAAEDLRLATVAPETARQNSSTHGPRSR